MDIYHLWINWIGFLSDNNLSSFFPVKSLLHLLSLPYFKWRKTHKNTIMLLPSIIEISAQADLNSSLKCCLNCSITINIFIGSYVHLSHRTINTRFFIIDGMWVTIREIDDLFCGVSSTLTESSYLCFHFSCAAGMVS